MENLISFIENGKNEFAGKLLSFTVILLTAVIFVFLVRKLLEKLFQSSRDVKDPKRARRVKTLLVLTINCVRGFVYFFVTIFFLDMMGVKTGSLMAAAGLVSVAVGFGAQSLVKDALSGAFIIAEDQFGVGDYISVNADTKHDGTVVNFSMRSTRLKDGLSSFHTIPNGTITSVINFSRSPYTCHLSYPVSISVPVDDTIKILRETLDEFYDENKEAVIEIPIVQGISEFTDTCYKIQIAFICDVKDHWRLSKALNNALLSKWQKAGYKCPRISVLVEKEGGFDA